MVLENIQRNSDSPRNIDNNGENLYNRKDKQRLTQVWCNGNTSASQADNAGSIPVTRSQMKAFHIL